MSAGTLLGIAIGAIIILLLLVIKVKMSAFVALLLVALGTALATNIPVGEVVPVMQAGMGNTLSSVMLVVGLGAILGRLIEVGGGADALAQRFTKALGQKRIIAAVTAAAFVLGIPVFFDVAFIIHAPIVFGFARVANINPLKLGLPVGGVLLTVHVALPPHPGPVAAAGIIGSDVGVMLLIGLPISALTGVVGYYAAKRIKTDGIVLLDSPATAAAPVSVDRGGDRDPAGDGSVVGTVKRRMKSIGAGIVMLLILLPILQITLGTVGDMVLDEGTAAQRWLSMIGSSAITLLTGVIVAYLVIGNRLGWTLEKGGSILDSALPDVAVIVFVTGAGGVFANVLVQPGIGAALSDTLVAWNMPIILAGFLISLALRASQGSATVAILTTAGLMSEPIAAAGYSSIEAVLVTLAIALAASDFHTSTTRVSGSSRSSWA